MDLLTGEWDWISQVFLVVLATVAVNAVLKRALRRLYERLKATRSPWDDAVVDALRRPLPLLVWVVGLAFAGEIIYRTTQTEIFAAVDPIRDVGVIACLAWFLVRLIAAVENNLIARHETGGEAVDRTTADAVSKLLRVSVLITAALVALQTLGFNISGILAFGGIGGIAVGFAAKDLLANFFGGLMVYLDRPFEVGDWIRSPDRDIEGTVENIGWRLTCIRTFDKRPVYVPNSTFANIAVENPTRMSHRRIYETIGVRYDDAPRLEAILTDVRVMIMNHEELDTSQTTMVRFNEFADSSLNFFIYCFTRTTQWTEYHRVKEDVLLRIHQIIQSHEAEVAFPTSTVHLPDLARGDEESELPEPVSRRRPQGLAEALPDGL